MPHTTHQGVAPLNPQPRWAEGDIAVLREVGAQQKVVLHCLACCAGSWQRELSDPSLLPGNLIACAESPDAIHPLILPSRPQIPGRGGKYL
jgi:hypothetical protein